ncbi:MAG: hypothetical protein M9947_10425 [Thermomicrobiales bacterium]|nr:hypothetical protein [Thermomicrobiales bacterium]
MMEEWGNFFVAMAGASVAFAGLVLVSVSINLKQILKQPGLISRAGKPLVVLFTLFVASSIMLIPDQRRSFYGIELMLLALAFAVAISAVLRNQHRRAQTAPPPRAMPRYSLQFRVALFR